MEGCKGTFDPADCNQPSCKVFGCPHLPIDAEPSLAEQRRIRALELAHGHAIHGEPAGQTVERATQFESYLAGFARPEVFPERAPGLQEVIAELYASEINCGLRTFWDGGVEVWLGDHMNGTHARETLFPVPHDRQAMLRRAASWLHRNALERFPQSTYAERFVPKTGFMPT